MPNIVFDIDGIILDFNKKFIEWFKDKTGEQLQHNPNHFYYEVDYKGDKEFLTKCVFEFVEKEEKHLEPICEEILELPGKLRKLGYKVYLITAYRNRECRIKNLKHYGVEYDEIIFDRNKLPHVEKINPVFCVEDRLETIKEYSEAGYKVLVPGSWNYVKPLIDDSNPNIIPYYSTKELEEIILKKKY